MSDEKEEESKEINEEKKDFDEESKKKKVKFTFKCTRCDACCLKRGPIPITQWDLETWARNGVLENFFSYLEINTNSNGTMDLILKPFLSQEKDEKNADNILKGTSIEDLLEEKCPLYNKEKKECLVYENRPLSCRTYPLEYNGTNFTIVDTDCPGIGEEGMSKEELKDMRDIAQKMNYELTRIRISLPVFNQILSRKVVMDLMRQNMEAMSKMTDEDRAKLDEIFKKSKETNEN